jgi:2'-5' RNA ligase
VTVLYDTPEVAPLAALVSATPPLRLRAGAVERWTDEPGIYVAVLDPHGDLRRFRRAALGADDPAYRPHITLLHRDSVVDGRQADDVWTALRETTVAADFTVTELRVYEEREGVWRDAARLRFASGEIAG